MIQAFKHFASPLTVDNDNIVKIRNEIKPIDKSNSLIEIRDSFEMMTFLLNETSQNEHHINRIYLYEARNV